MAKYYGISGKKVGKVGNEKYYIDRGQNIVQEKGKYVPVNNTWIKREKFKEYILSLFDLAVPQIYVLDELPQDIYPYALLFVKNNNINDIYVDKDGKRNKIEVGGQGQQEQFDPVDVVNELPQNPDPDKLFFVKKSIQQRNSTVYEIYTSDNGILTKIDIDLSPAVGQANVYTNFQISELREELNEEIDTKTQPITDITTNSLKNVYNTTLDANKILASTKDGYVTASPLGFADAYDTINGIRTKALKNMYYKYVSGNKVIISDSNGYLQTSAINALTAQNVINGVDGYSLKNIYNTTLDTDRVIVSDGDGYLKASGTTYNTLDVTLSGIRTKALKNVYNSYLSANKNVITDGNGRISYADMPHLYMHYLLWDRGGTGEVVFVIYNTSSSNPTVVDVHNFLYNLGCDANWKIFPATGVNPNGYHIAGIYASTYSSGGIIDRGFTTVAYNGTTMYENYYTNYDHGQVAKTIQIF